MGKNIIMDLTLDTNKKNIEKFKESLNSMGYSVTNPEYYKITRGPHEDKVGVKVGSYLHSCHIESSDIIVLLVMDGDREVTTFSAWEMMDCIKL